MLKKFLKIVVILICVMSLTLPHTSIVLATVLSSDDSNDANTINLIGVEFHEGGKESTNSLLESLIENYDARQLKYTFNDSSNSTSVLKIVREDDKNEETGEILYSDAFYCLDGNDNFPTIYGAIKYSRTMENFFEENPTTLTLTDSDYNSLCWLISNMYLRKQMSIEQREKQKNSLFENAYKEIIEDTTTEPTVTIDDIKSIVTDDDIEVVQQWAIWYFTNNGENTLQDVPFVNYNEKEQLVLPALYLEDNSLTGDYINRIRKEYMNTLYRYYVNTALTYGDTEFDEYMFVYPQIAEQDATCVVEGNYYKVGPFKISSGSDLVNYSIKLYNGENEILPSEYIIKDANNDEVDKEISEILDENYYLCFPIAENTIRNVKLNLTYTESDINASLWQATDKENYQPIILITRDEGEVISNIDVDIKGQFDLSLQKFISKINNKELEESRVPNVVFENNNFTYQAPNTPVKVKVGDEVTYSIRVFNEGEIDGYASEIKDDIPNGLRFDSNNETNIKYGWKMYDQDGNITNNESEAVEIRTDYLSKEKSDEMERKSLLEAFNKENAQINHQEVEVVFTVENVTSNKEIINTAEISKDSDKDGNEISDKDSTPDNDIIDEDDIDNEKIIVLTFDLSLQKFITKINGKFLKQIREPFCNTKSLLEGRNNAEYETKKDIVTARIGDKVTYTIRIYNEGQIDGYANRIVDYLPEGLGYLVEYKGNIDNCWSFDTENISMTTLGEIQNGTSKLSLNDFTNITDLNNVNVVKGAIKLTSNALERTNSEENLIMAYDSFNDKIKYKDIQITCVVLSENGLKNIAEIAENTDRYGDTVIDRDSTPNTVNPNDYPGNDENQDDNDIENLTIVNFDLSLKKFITGVNDTSIKDREPAVQYKNGELITRNVVDTPVEVKKEDKVTYTIRVYNEGEVDGYASEICDDIPEGLIFDSSNSVNQKYDWKMYDKDGDVTTDTEKAVKIKTNYLSKVQADIRGEDALLRALNKTTGEISFQDVQVVFTVSSSNKSQIIINTAEITDDTDIDGNDIEDRDSTPDNGNENEDDLDKEKIKVGIFDLSLQKFISGVNNTEVKDRVPTISYENGKIKFEHTKTPLEVNTTDTVIYTIRVYNEGDVDGYATEISDDIPNGLIFDISNSINKKYGWVMYDKDGKETNNAGEAVKIKTDYLSKEKSDARNDKTLLKALKTDEKTLSLTYFDVKVAFVVSSSSKDSTLINTAEIVEDSDYNGNEIDDIDSIPNNGNEKEDDIDKEIIHVGCFDLALQKSLVKAVIIENEKTKEIESKDGKLMKVEINRKNINSTIVKFVYNITVRNEGSIDGYVTGIKDYIPEGLEFVESDNTNDWKVISNGVIQNESLNKTLLKPGETKTVQVVLRWINGNDNFGLKTNTAEISSDFNDANDIDDVDSTPDNKEKGEDDIDYAEVILSISTGLEKINLALFAIILCITSTGVIIFKKFVLKN